MTMSEFVPGSVNESNLSSNGRLRPAIHNAYPVRGSVKRLPESTADIGLNNPGNLNGNSQLQAAFIAPGTQALPDCGVTAALPTSASITHMSEVNLGSTSTTTTTVNTATATTSSVAPSGSENLYVALHDYVKRVDDDLNMTKGQTFRILDRSHCDWWYAECTTTGQRGYVPKNHLARVTSLESNEWYFGELRRIEAEHYLQLPGNDHGSFLVRVSESQSSEYSLSVREEDTIKHYRIRSRSSRTNPDLKRFYISRQLPFVTIQQLVGHYTENQSGLCCRLSRPCIK
ncbi:Tyrosine-protein kinase FRK, partial [Fasciolopsis buskii]